VTLIEVNMTSGETAQPLARHISSAISLSGKQP